jgi:hypothetical protein
MATTTSLTTSYIGEAATELINKMFFGAKTVGEGNITIKDDVNKSYKIRRLTGSDMIAAPSCDFTPSGTVTIDEQSLTPAPFEVNLQMCKKDFKHVDWSSVRMGTGANRQLSQDVIDAIFAEILGHVGNEIEMSVWRGNTAGATYTLIDGFTKLMTAGVAAGNKTTPAAWTAATAVAKFVAMYDIAAAQPWFDAPDLAFWVAPNIAAMYKQALANQGYMDQYQVGDKPLNFVGVPIYVAPGLAGSTAVMSHKGNLFFGTESVSNFNEVILKDMADVDLSDNVRFKAYATMGVAVGWYEEVVLHLPS